jgi:hypothetical protein
VVSTQKAGERKGTNQNICPTAEEIEPNAKHKNLAVGEEEHGPIPQRIVKADLAELPNPVSIYKRNQSKKDEHDHHGSRIEKCARVPGEFPVYISVDPPVDGNPGGQVIVQNKRSCETKQDGDQGVTISIE